MRQRSNTIANRFVRIRFMDWVKKNICNTDLLYKVDWDSEFGDDLTYSEAVDMALYKFPTLWREDSVKRYYTKIKQIVFIRPLIPKIILGEIDVTYRKTPKFGFYYIVDNRFRPQLEPKVLLEFYKVEQIDPYMLNDYDAKLAGVETSRELISLFKRWYHGVPRYMYRNFFRIIYE